MGEIAALPQRGQPPRTKDYQHPLWADGSPILVGQDVRVPDGWIGFVSTVTCEEITVWPYGEDGDYWEEQLPPDDLTLVLPEPATTEEASPHG